MTSREKIRGLQELLSAVSRAERIAGSIGEWSLAGELVDVAASIVKKIEGHRGARKARKKK